MADLELPHGVWVDDDTGFVTIPLERITITLALHEFAEFADQIADVAMVLGQMTTAEIEECDSCGTEIASIGIAPLDDADFN